ncbi:MAG: IPT/TIG domain-containing protein, partial [Solirubrobacteraceae bacterium]|nr:IPT/TIG domain-containing protein [Solirubrobacteraceae bacterium]
VATPAPTTTPVATPAPTSTPVATPAPTTTPVATPAPTSTPVATPAPTSTPVATPKPTTTPVATPAPTKLPVVSKVVGAGYGYIGGIALISGSNFNNVKSVKFGTLNAPSGFAIGTSQLIVIAPAQKPGTVKVTVETPAGVSQENVNFTYKKLF